MIYWRLCIIIGLLANPSHGLATQSLEQLNKKIAAIEQSLLDDKSKFNELTAALKKIDLQIQQCHLQHQAINTQLATKEQTLAELNSTAHTIKQQLSIHHQQLRKQLQISYRLFQYDHLKLLFSPIEPSQISQLSHYYTYLHQARIQQIYHIDTTLNKLYHQQEQNIKKTKQLQQLRTQKFNTLQQLQQQKSQRARLLQAIERTMHDKTQQRQELLENKKQLTQLFNKLQHETQTKPSAPTPPLAFHQQQGQLPWPCQGDIITHFNERLTDLNIRSQGIYITTHANQPIHAIASGQVVFANWFRGYGLLLIIDHGAGFMSLYAHNNTLYRTTGDAIQANQVIAASGQSGGIRQNSLYFEIRKHGKALNPINWLKKIRS